MGNIVAYRNHWKRFYGVLLGTLLAGFILLSTLKLGEPHKHTTFFSTIKGVVTSYLFKNAQVSWGVYLIILSPLIYWVLNALLTAALPTEGKAIAQLAKTKKVVAMLLGLTAGLLVWLIILIINGHSSHAGSVLLAASILWTIALSVSMFGVDHAPEKVVKLVSQPAVPAAKIAAPAAVQPAAEATPKA